MKRTEQRHHAGDEAIDATAAAWLAQRDDGFTADEAAEFARWRSADVRHERAVARLESAWGALQMLRDFRPEARMHPDRDLLATPRARHIVSFPALAAVTAVAAVVAFVAIRWSRAPAGLSVTEAPHYATTADGYQRTTLPDGSVLELNASSELRVEFTPGERRVQLVRGEAHFTVAKNKARPFLVVAGGIVVRAVGTAFDVRLGSDHVAVLVTEGKVEVNPPEREEPGLGAGAQAAGNSALSPSSVASPSSPLDSRSPTFLVAGQRVFVPTDRAVPVRGVETVAPETIREELAWQGARLVFVETPLAEVVTQFNRRNQVQLELADAGLGTLPVGGSFRAENVEAFVRLLSSDKDIVIEHPDANRIVLRKAP